MNRFILTLSIIILSLISAPAQTTATDFTATDCNSVTHNLFTDINAGKIVVMVWVMPCGTCISDAKAAFDAAQSFATTYPGRVEYWLSDDAGNTVCSTLSTWASTNGITTTKISIFSNLGNVIDEAKFGGSGMPHVAVIGGGNHKIYLNIRNGSNDGVAITAAINQALVTGINSKALTINNDIKIYPNPAKDKLTLKFTNDINTINSIDIFNVLGEKVQTVIPAMSVLNNNILDISLSKELLAGNYFIKVVSGDSYNTLRFTLVN